VRISFPLKTPAQLAERLGISGARLGRLLAIADESSRSETRPPQRFKSKSQSIHSRSARRSNAKTPR
jgi:hypothetical protein